MPFSAQRLPNINDNCEDMIEECEKAGRLRSHQIEALQKLRTRFDSPRATTDIALVCMPTGSGKTGIIAALPYYLASIKNADGQPRYLFNKPILVVAPDLTIQNQLEEELTHLTQMTPFLKRINVVPPDRHDILPKASKIDNTAQIRNPDFLKTNELVIANAQKFGGDDWPRELDSNLFRLVMVDEAHHHPAKTWRRIVEKFRNTECPVVFFTATPFRTDGQKVLDLQEDGIAYYLSLNEAVSRRIIRKSDFKVVSGVGPEPVFRNPNAHTDNDRRITSNMLAILAKVKELLGEKRRISPNAPHMAMAICNNTTQANLLLELWKGSSLPDELAECYHSQKSEYERKNIMERIRNNELSLVIIVAMLLEGFDHPPISIAAITYKIESHVRFVQFVGRAQRIYRQGGYREPKELCADIVTHEDYEQRSNYDNFTNEAFHIGDVD